MRNDWNLGRIPVARILEKVDGLFAKNDTLEAGRLLAYWKDEAIALQDKQGELSMHSELIGFYRKQNDPQKGLESINRALALVKELEQEETASGGTIFLNCATAYQAFGLSEKAISLYEQAQQIYHRVLPQGDARFGGLYNNMALALVSLGRFQEAKRAYFSALSVMEQVPRGQAERAITYINLAYLHQALEEPRQIKDCMDKAYTLLQSDHLPRDGYYAFVLEKCAPAFRDFDQPEIYEQLKAKAEDIYARN